MKEEKIKFYEKSEDLKAIDAGLEFTKARVERILEEWRKVTDGATLTMEIVTDFTTLNFLGARLPDEDKILKYVMTEKVRHSPLFGEIDLDALIRITTKRPDITALVKAVRGLSDHIPGPLFDPTDQYRPYCFRINGDRVELVTDLVEQVRSFYVAYAVNTEEKHRLKLVQAIIDAYNDLKLEYDVPLHKVAVAGLVAYDAINERLLPSPDFVKDGRIVTGNYMGSASAFTDTTPTIGDIRTRPDFKKEVYSGEIDAVIKIANKRNARQII